MLVILLRLEKYNDLKLTHEKNPVKLKNIKFI
jgi:hypothetical protein